MLKLKNIRKDYLAGESTVHALKGIDLEFRENEFVAILGHSGCGKTTLLNIIGGLDQYTAGDLIINGKSTKHFTDGDWDSYRNHSIGFVFQSYNLIPHQTVLSNVELALTLSGVGKSERRARAKEALEKVGLGDQLYKKPNQMSGGQMQRVAIARALVNNPDILLADEPTGALDSDTSVQIMDLLKEISRDKLIIMVTHNPDLAQGYASRIIRLKDGLIVDDSDPYDSGVTEEAVRGKKQKKTSMGFFTALALSTNNLMTKKARTLLTAFAGSIGIIGIALIMSLSNGIQNYIDKVQEDTLSSYPITIQAEAVDMTPYAEDVNGHIGKTDAVQIMQTAMSASFGGDYTSYFSTYGQMFSTLDIWQEMLPGEEGELINPLLEKQYDVLYGRWPRSFDEVVLIVNENNEISDLVLYSLGLKATDSIAENMDALMSAEAMDTELESWSYEEICQMSFRYVYAADKYSLDEESGEYVDLSEEELGLRTLYNNGLEVKIVGVIRQNDDAVSANMTGAVGYTHALVEHILTETAEKELVKKQLQDPTHEVFTGLLFLDREDETLTNTKKINAAKDYLAGADTATIADIYVQFMSEPSDEYLSELLDEQLEGTTREDIEKMVLENFPEYSSMLSKMDDDMLFNYIKQMVTDQIKTQYAAQMAELYRQVPEAELAKDFELLDMDDKDYLWVYDNAMPPVFSSSTLKDTLKKLGYADLDSPSIINIYASTFENKDAIGEAIERYNETVDEEDQISYTDVVALLMSSITTIIKVISYVLIAFVAISLVVSSIMIGIITYISVLERTKEIGILRAIGASKRDVSRVFNAETFIIGFFAGAIGIGMTLLLNIPINIIVHDLTGILVLNSTLPAVGGVGLVIISVVLTFIAGLIPSGLAAKKDPVEALRTE